MLVEFLTYSGINKMEKALAHPDVIKIYETGEFRPLVPKEDVRSSRFEASEPPKIIALTKPSQDAEASMLIHGWLKQLKPAEAADGRLWTLLSHHTFAEYSATRWLNQQSKDSDITNIILSRLFMKGDSMKRLFRNSIGRLWWFAHVSFDRNRANPYELLPILLSNQNIQSALLERRIGMCRNLLIAVLELVNEFGGIKSEVIKSVGRNANLLAGGILLDHLSKEELKKRLHHLFSSPNNE